MNLNLIRIAVTLLSLAAFIGIVWWAYRPANRRRFQADAQIPLTDEPGDTPVYATGRSTFPE